MKVFFKVLRIILGPVLLLKEYLCKPSGMHRSKTEQEKVDLQCKKLAFYQFKTCPFCIKVRQEMRRLSLSIEQRDAQHSAEHRTHLLQQGGHSKVPCLQITNEEGNVQWLYESQAIIQYLRTQFA